MKNDKELVIADFDNRFNWVSGEQRTLSRGFAAQVIHFSEHAHWKDTALKLLGGAIAAVPSSGQIDLESTPNGEQGAFYEFAMNQSRPMNPDGLWRVHMYPWWMEARYTVSDTMSSGADIILPAEELAEREINFKPDEHEFKLMEVNGLTPRHMLWRRLKKAQQDATQAPFLQEYPEDLDTCWLGVEGRFFDTPDGIDHLEYYREARREPVRRFESLPFKGDQVSFYGPNFAVWEFPDQDDTYCMGFDAAGGGVTKDADYSVLYVMSIRKEKIVAELRGRMSPKIFAAMIAAVGTFYKNATVNGEREGRGAMVFEELRALGYTNIYYHVDPMKPLSKNERAQPGMYPTQANRQNVLEKLKAGITGHALESFAPELVREMNVFTWVKFQNRMKAMALDIVGNHDDCIFAAAYCWFIIDKVRNRLRRERFEDQIITTGPNNMVVRREDQYSQDRSRQLWLN